MGLIQTRANHQIIAMTIGLASLLTASVAFASSVHLKGGRNAEPSFFDLGEALNAQGDLAGLGNEDVLITLEAEGDVTATCTNKGGTAAPGQNPAPISVAGTESIPAEEIDNGNLAFDVTTQAVGEIAGAPDCPNGNWTETIDDIAFTSATITVEQGGAEVLVIDCTFNPATSDGAVLANTVDCTQSTP